MSQPVDNPLSNKDEPITNNRTRKSLLKNWLPAILITIVLYSIGVVIFLMIAEYKQQQASDNQAEQSVNKPATANNVSNNRFNADGGLWNAQMIVNQQNEAVATANGDDGGQNSQGNNRQAQQGSNSNSSYRHSPNRNSYRRSTQANSRSSRQRRNAANRSQPSRHNARWQTPAATDQLDESEYYEETQMENPNDVILLSRDLPGVIQDEVIDNKQYDKTASEVEDINNKISSSIEAVKRKNMQSIEARKPKVQDSPTVTATKPPTRSDSSNSSEASQSTSTQSASEATGVAASTKPAQPKPTQPKPAASKHLQDKSTMTYKKIEPKRDKPVEAKRPKPASSALKDNSKVSIKPTETPQQAATTE